MAIHLCDLPGSVCERAALSLLDLAPGGVYLATPVARSAGALLPHLFTLTGWAGGLFSVALSCESPRLVASQHPALRSPDLPRPAGSGPRPSDRHPVTDATLEHAPSGRTSHGTRRDGADLLRVGDQFDATRTHKPRRPPRKLV